MLIPADDIWYKVIDLFPEFDSAKKYYLENKGTSCIQIIFRDEQPEDLDDSDVPLYAGDGVVFCEDLRSTPYTSLWLKNASTVDGDFGIIVME